MVTILIWMLYLRILVFLLNIIIIIFHVSSSSSLGLQDSELGMGIPKKTGERGSQASWNILASGELHTFIVQSPCENVHLLGFPIIPDTVIKLHST